MAAAPTRHRFTVEEYHRMAEAGILDEDLRVELLDGEIVEMSPVGSRHVACVNRLDALLQRHLAHGSAIVQVQSPIHLGEHQEPEPDVVVLRFRPDYYADALPRPADVLLLIEVAESSLPIDRGVKLALYARAGIPEVWIVELETAVIERHVGPTGGMYARTERAVRGATIASAALPSLTLRLDEILGAAK